MSEAPLGSPAHAARTRLRALVARGRTIAVPGATDALSARLIEAHGFDAV
jgi:2-methylisocitrate lyase-like PEP mutase family enzyme